MTTDKEIEQLRAQIARIRGRRPRSRNAEYLREHLADLQARVAAGETVRPVAQPRARPATVSLLPDQLAALDKLSDKTRRSRSELVRIALAAYARAEGHAAIARVLDGD